MSDGHEKPKGNRGLWNVLFSILDPEIKKLAQRLAATIPSDSPLRGELVERFIGVAKSLIESRAESLPAPFAAALEKVTDGADFFNVYLGGKDHGGESIRTEQAWMDKFFAEASQRMAKADNPTDMAVRLEEEFILRVALLEMIDKERKKLHPAKPHEEVKPIDFASKWQRIKTGFKTGDTAVASYIDGITAWVQPKPRTTITERVRSAVMKVRQSWTELKRAFRKSPEGADRW